MATSPTPRPPANSGPNPGPNSGPRPGSQPGPQPSGFQAAEIAFDQPVVLKQSPVWSRAVIWAIVGVTSFSIGWACLAEVDEAIPAQGKLEPGGAVKDIQAPQGGVISAIEVKEGQTVEAGQPLITLDQTAAKAQKLSLEQIRSTLLAENLFYKSQLGQANAPTVAVKIPDALQALTENRAGLLEENRLYRAQLGGSTASLNASQQARLRTNLSERDSRLETAQLETAQLQQQFAQTQVKLDDARNRLVNAQTKLVNTQEKLGNARVQLANANNNLKVDRGILDKIAPLAEEGGIANIQVLRQEQQVGDRVAEVNTRQTDITNQQTEIDNQRTEIATRQSEVVQLQQEAQRLTIAVNQSGSKQQNTIAQSQQDPMGRIAENEKRVSEIDSQISKQIVENNKRLQEIGSQLSQANQTLKYQNIISPVRGVVFDLKPKSAGFVVNSSEPILKVVPSEGLVARVFITNRDIGFVYPGMKVDVRIDSFPYSEFSDIEGTLEKIGSDALPPDQINQFYRFPADIKLKTQTLNVDDKKIVLQSGMSISVNIKTRKRKVISYFSDMFNKKIDSFTSGR
jgi:hemolysin D